MNEYILIEKRLSDGTIEEAYLLKIKSKKEVDKVLSVFTTMVFSDLIASKKFVFKNSPYAIEFSKRESDGVLYWRRYTDLMNVWRKECVIIDRDSDILNFESDEDAKLWFEVTY